MAGVAQRTMFRLRRDVDQKLARLPLRYFDDHSRGDVLSRVTNDIDNISQSLQQSLTQIITSVLTIIGVLIMMLTISPLLAAASRCSACRSRSCVTIMIAKRSQKQFAAQWKHTGDLNGHVEEMFTGHNVVKVFGRQDEAIATFDGQNDQLYEASFKAQFISGIILPVMNFVSNLNYVAICVVGGLGVANGTHVARRRDGLHPVLAPVHDADHAGGQHHERAAVDGGVGRARLRAARRARGGGRPGRAGRARAHARPHRARGRVVPLPGRHAADRRPRLWTCSPVRRWPSSVRRAPARPRSSNLLLRFYEIDHGRITIDGVDTRDMTRNDLRRLFGMVLQDTWLFSGTIRDNIAYGREGATDDEIMAAAQRGARRPLRAHAARRLRHGARRRRDQRLAGREAAADDRPGVPGRSRDPHPRRGHELGRHAHRGADPGGHGRADEGPHELRHRPPALHHPRRRHHPRHGPRAHRRAGHRTRSCWRRAASTTTCTTASSRERSKRRRSS